MRKTKSLWIVALVVGLAPVASAENLAEGLETGEIQYFFMSDSPVSGPVEMIVNSSHPTVQQGTFTDVFLVVQNHANDATVSVNIELELIYADGTPVRPFHLGADRIHTLGPDEGVGFLVFWVIPSDAPLGKGTFRASARIGRVDGDDGHRENPNPMIASDSVEFEVVAPSP